MPSMLFDICVVDAKLSFKWDISFKANDMLSYLALGSEYHA